MILRSREIWSAIEHNEELAEGEEKQALEPPKYHIGRVDKDGTTLKKSPSGKGWALPWERGDRPDKALGQLVHWTSFWINPNPQLDRLFDYYLRMVWQLALAVPLPYVGGHVFDEAASGWVTTYELSNAAKGAARRVPETKKTIRSVPDLADPKDEPGKFDVYIDDLKLARPIKFKDLPTTAHALKTPLVFIGKCEQSFSKLPIELSGGPLSFEAYLFLKPKIAPGAYAAWVAAKS